MPGKAEISTVVLAQLVLRSHDLAKEAAPLAKNLNIVAVKKGVEKAFEELGVDDSFQEPVALLVLHGGRYAREWAVRTLRGQG